MIVLVLAGNLIYVGLKEDVLPLVFPNQVQHVQEHGLQVQPVIITLLVQHVDIQLVLYNVVE